MGRGPGYGESRLGCPGERHWFSLRRVGWSRRDGTPRSESGTVLVYGRTPETFESTVVRGVDPVHQCQLYVPLRPCQ